MSLPTPDIWTNFLALSQILGIDNLTETRIENDINGKILYFGLTAIANAPTSSPVWFILKLSYDVNGFLSYKQLPNLGSGYIYIWDNRTTYF